MKGGDRKGLKERERNGLRKKERKDGKEGKENVVEEEGIDES